MEFDQVDLLDEGFDNIDLDDGEALSCLLAEYESYGARRPLAPCIDGVAWSDGGAV